MLFRTLRDWRIMLVLLMLVGYAIYKNAPKIFKKGDVAESPEVRYRNFVIDSLEQSLQRQIEANAAYLAEIESMEMKMDSMKSVMLANQEKLNELQKRKQNEKTASYSNWSNTEFAKFFTERYNSK